MKIAYLGDEYSHTYSCAAKLISSEDILVAYPTIRGSLLSVFEGKSEMCVSPLENSVEGTVNECIDAILDLNLYIQKEMIEPIHEHLIGFKNAKKSDLKIIYSHPQAISQCRKYLETNFMPITIEAQASTSAGMKKITDISIGAIAGNCNKDLCILEENIEDYKSNATRFVLLGKKPSFDGNKVSIVFTSLNEPGALLKVLQVIADFKLNMTKIESRPHKSGLGKYIFYIDFNFNKDKTELTKVLEKISEKTNFLKFLGKY